MVGDLSGFEFELARSRASKSPVVKTAGQVRTSDAPKAEFAIWFLLGALLRSSQRLRRYLLQGKARKSPPLNSVVMPNQELVEHIRFTQHHRTRPHDRVRASCLTTRLCARIRRKTMSTARTSLMLIIRTWLLTLLKFTACRFGRNGSRFSSGLEVNDAFATTVEEYASTLANYSVEIWKSSEDSSSRTSWFYMRVQHPSEAVDMCEFWVCSCCNFLLASLPLFTLQREVCSTASDG